MRISSGCSIVSRLITCCGRLLCIINKKTQLSASHHLIMNYKGIILGGRYNIEERSTYTLQIRVVLLYILLMSRFHMSS